MLWTKKVIMLYFVGLNRFKKREYKRILALGILIKARAGRYIVCTIYRYILYNRYVIMKQYS